MYCIGIHEPYAILLILALYAVVAVAPVEVPFSNALQRLHAVMWLQVRKERVAAPQGDKVSILPVAPQCTGQSIGSRIKG
jgi:hypothetical protein